MFPLVQDVMEAAGTPLKVTVLLPWLLPKLVPLMFTGVPETPEFGDTWEMDGVGITVKFNPLLAFPLEDTNTLMLPVGPFAGTIAVTEFSFCTVAVT
jgi:hypothetical protein